MENLMYAVIQTGGKQYRISRGEVLKVERMPHLKDHPIEFKGICFLREGEVCPATVIARPLEAVRGRKVIIFKKRRRHNSRRKNGHRQEFLKIQVEQVVAHKGGEDGA